MSIPLRWDDDDFFISTTLQDALFDVMRLDSGLIETTSRDEFGEEQRCICTGVNLRRSIDAAVLYETPNVELTGAPPTDASKGDGA